MSTSSAASVLLRALVPAHWQEVAVGPAGLGRGRGVAWPGLAPERGMTCPALQAEEELIKAQKVFEEMNVDLQEELPSLWNR